MARFQWPWNRRAAVQTQAPVSARTTVVGATSDDYRDRLTFDNRNITSQSVLSDYNFDKILRDKQANIVS